MDVPINKEPWGQKQIYLSELIERVRRAMRDRSHLNRLIAGEENSNEDIMQAIDLCISDFNHTPPFIHKYNYQNPPPLYLLIKGTIIQLLESKGLLESRNAIQFNDGGMTASYMDKDQRTQSWLAHFSNKYEVDKEKWKKSVNIEESFGESLSSEYVIVNNLGWLSIIS